VTERLQAYSKWPASTFAGMAKAAGDVMMVEAEVVEGAKLESLIR
jgi:hypothetical protein